MCGRLVITSSAQDISEHFGGVDIGALSNSDTLNFNVAPTNQLLSLRRKGDKSSLDELQWGMQPLWLSQNEGRALVINARAETITEKPMFRDLIASGRCVVAVNGYYEWLTTHHAQQKIPYFISAKEMKLINMCALWHTRVIGDTAVKEVAIITVAANESLSAVHHRMPAILEPSNVDTWLSGPIEESVQLLQSWAGNPLQLREVSTRVNAVRNNSAENIAQVPTQVLPTLFD
jgi:putative SOS response-associated peptidase YedK